MWGRTVQCRQRVSPSMLPPLPAYMPQRRTFHNPPVSYAHLLAELQGICGRAAVIAIEAREKLDHKLKPDGSIVTNADDLVELYVDASLLQLLPGSTVWGEESGFCDEG